MMLLNIFKVLQTISTLRNKNRWAAQAYSMECSVLGHLFDTAIFAYFMSLEEKPEDKANKKYKKLLKGADYLSADSECWRQYVAGSRDEYFLGAMMRRLPGIETGEVLLTTMCSRLFDYFFAYAKKVQTQ